METPTVNDCVPPLRSTRPFAGGGGPIPSTSPMSITLEAYVEDLGSVDEQRAEERALSQMAAEDASSLSGFFDRIGFEG